VNPLVVDICLAWLSWDLAFLQASMKALAGAAVDRLTVTFSGTSAPLASRSLHDDES